MPSIMGPGGTEEVQTTSEDLDQLRAEVEKLRQERGNAWQKEDSHKSEMSRRQKEHELEMEEQRKLHQLAMEEKDQEFKQISHKIEQLETEVDGNLGNIDQIEYEELKDSKNCPPQLPERFDFLQKLNSRNMERIAISIGSILAYACFQNYQKMKQL